MQMSLGASWRRYRFFERRLTGAQRHLCAEVVWSDKIVLFENPYIYLQVGRIKKMCRTDGCKRSRITERKKEMPRQPEQSKMDGRNCRFSASRLLKPERAFVFSCFANALNKCNKPRFLAYFFVVGTLLGFSPCQLGKGFSRTTCSR